MTQYPHFPIEMSCIKLHLPFPSSETGLSGRVSPGDAGVTVGELFPALPVTCRVAGANLLISLPAFIWLAGRGFEDETGSVCVCVCSAEHHGVLPHAGAETRSPRGWE